MISSFRNGHLRALVSPWTEGPTCNQNLSVFGKGCRCAPPLFIWSPNVCLLSLCASLPLGYISKSLSIMKACERTCACVCVHALENACAYANVSASFPVYSCSREHMLHSCGSLCVPALVSLCSGTINMDTRKAHALLPASCQHERKYLFAHHFVHRCKQQRYNRRAPTSFSAENDKSQRIIKGALGIMHAKGSSQQARRKRGILNCDPMIFLPQRT